MAKNRNWPKTENFKKYLPDSLGADTRSLLGGRHSPYIKDPVAAVWRTVKSLVLSINFMKMTEVTPTVSESSSPKSRLVFWRSESIRDGNADFITITVACNLAWVLCTDVSELEQCYKSETHCGTRVGKQTIKLLLMEWLHSVNNKVNFSCSSLYITFQV